MKNEPSAALVKGTVLRLLAISLFPVSHTLAQGNLNFANLDGNRVNAPVTFANGTGVGKGYKAQIYAGPPNTPAGSLTPVLPTTIFRENAPGYILAFTLEIPGRSAGEDIVVQMRAYDNENWENSDCRGESNVIPIRLSGGTGVPTSLIGLQPFQVVCIPEPGTTFICCAGLGLIALWKIRPSR
jgi:hypothetical protein